jgi:hypothetical protein
MRYSFTPEETQAILVEHYPWAVEAKNSMKKPWKYSPNARTCRYCKSQKPGMQPLTLFVNNKPVRGYWHLKCFEKAKKELAKETK